MNCQKLRLWLLRVMLSACLLNLCHLSRRRHHHHHHHHHLLLLLLLLLHYHLHHRLIVLTACKSACYIALSGEFFCVKSCVIVKFVFAIRLATGHEPAHLYKVTCCIQNSRSSISGLVECLRLFHVNPKSVSNCWFSTISAAMLNNGSIWLWK